MANISRPKAILFDIGGVCVLSPMQAILDYEVDQRIPRGWINVAISGSKPNGAWHRMERGEMTVGPAFYDEFARDLSNEKLWPIYCSRIAAKAGKEVDSSTLGPAPQIDTKKLLDAIITISRNPDPHVYPALKKLKASNEFVIGALSNTLTLSEDHWANQSQRTGVSGLVFTPTDFFDPFVSSAHSGVRKPEMKAYELTFDLLRQRHRVRFGGEELKPHDVVFLDDIGENLKQGRKMGFRTIKVLLGDTRSAVQELEKLVGIDLQEHNSKL